MLGIKRQPATRSVIGAGMRVQGPCTFSDGLHRDMTESALSLIRQHIRQHKTCPKLSTSPAQAV